MKKEFEFLPEPLDIEVGAIKINTLPDLKSKVDLLSKCSGVENGWVYAPPQQTTDIMTGKIRTNPYRSRIFGLRKTHTIEHETGTGEHLDFLVWLLSFFQGMRLTTTEKGFLDCTPVKPRQLVDFVVTGPVLERAVQMAEKFWVENRDQPPNAKLLVAAIHALFLGQNRLAFEFEKFLFLYTATDACFRLTKRLNGLGYRKHYKRIKKMCDILGLQTPDWATISGRSTVVSDLRNNAVHEALFGDEPLGFAVLEGPNVENLTLEMSHLVCRLVVALLGGQDDPYVKTPVNTRDVHELRLA